MLRRAAVHPRSLVRAFLPRPVIVSIYLSKLWSSQLLKHNEAAIELQIGPSSIYKQE